MSTFKEIKVQGLESQGLIGEKSGSNERVNRVCFPVASPRKAQGSLLTLNPGIIPSRTRGIKWGVVGGSNLGQPCARQVLYALCYGSGP